MNDWQEFSALTMPPKGFVLVYVEFDDPGALSQIVRAYFSHHDGYWRTPYGRLNGRATHWMELPDPPKPA